MTGYTRTGEAAQANVYNGLQFRAISGTLYLISTNTVTP